MSLFNFLLVPSTSPDADNLHHATSEPLAAIENASLHLQHPQEEVIIDQQASRGDRWTPNELVELVPSNTKETDYVAELDMTLNQLSGAGRLNNMEAQLLNVLRDACHMKDRFFLRLHQFACR